MDILDITRREVERHMADHSDVLAALDRFHRAGLTPVLSTNGGIPGADIEVTRGPRVPGQATPILAVTVTEAGLARLEAGK